MSDEKYLRDIKTQLTGSPDLDKYPGWKQLGDRTWLTGSRQSSMGRWN